MKKYKVYQELLKIFVQKMHEVVNESVLIMGSWFHWLPQSETELTALGEGKKRESKVEGFTVSRKDNTFSHYQHP